MGILYRSGKVLGMVWLVTPSAHSASSVVRLGAVKQVVKCDATTIVTQRFRSRYSFQMLARQLRFHQCGSQYKVRITSHPIQFPASSHESYDGQC